MNEEGEEKRVKSLSLGQGTWLLGNLNSFWH